jgi:hypothetical protein
VQRFHSSSGSFLPSVLFSEVRYTSSILALVLYYLLFCSLKQVTPVSSSSMVLSYLLFCSLKQGSLILGLPLGLFYLLFCSKIHQFHSSSMVLFYLLFSEARFYNSRSASGCLLPSVLFLKQGTPIPGLQGTPVPFKLCSFLPFFLFFEARYTNCRSAIVLPFLLFCFLK